MVFAFSVMPLVEICATALKSPVLGLYSRLAFDVYTVDAVPVVAAAESG